MKKFKFNKDFKGTQVVIPKHTELNVEKYDNIEYIMDGCFAIFELDSDMAKEYGEVVNRLW